LPGASLQKSAVKNQPPISGDSISMMPALQQINGIEFLLLAA